MFLSKHPLFSTFALFLKVSEVCNISNKCWLPNKLARNYFYTKHHTPLFYLKQNFALSITESLKHPLFTTFLLVLTLYEIFYISYKYQSPNNLAKHQYFYTRDFISLHHFKKNWCSPMQKFYKTSNFDHLFSIFKSEWCL